MKENVFIGGNTIIYIHILYIADFNYLIIIIIHIFEIDIVINTVVNK